MYVPYSFFFRTVLKRKIHIENNRFLFSTDTCLFQPGDYSISLKATGRNKHFWVQVDNGNKTFKIGTRIFTTMDALLKHYMASPIYTNDKTNERLFLIKPLPK